MSPNDADGMANSVDPDQTAVWSGSALPAQAYLSENLGSLRYLIYRKFCNMLLCQDIWLTILFISGPHKSANTWVFTNLKINWSVKILLAFDMSISDTKFKTK